MHPAGDPSQAAGQVADHHDQIAASQIWLDTN
jgi:hypothetical protein